MADALDEFILAVASPEAREKLKAVMKARDAEKRRNKKTVKVVDNYSGFRERDASELAHEDLLKFLSEEE